MMTEKKELPKLSNHSIHLLYELRFKADWTYEEFHTLANNEAHNPLRATLGDLVTKHRHNENSKLLTWIPSDVLPTLTQRYADTRIWQRTDLPIGDDLLKPVRHLFNRSDSQLAINSQLAISCSLQPQAQRLLSKSDLYLEATPRNARQQKQLTLQLSPAASRRVRARWDYEGDDELEVNIESIVATIFRTGFGLAHVKVRLAKSGESELHPVCLVEGVVALSRFNTMQWRILGPSSKLQEPVFTFGTIVHSLVEGITSESQFEARIYTVSYAEFNEVPDPRLARHFANQLARQYTDDYDLVDDPRRVHTVRDFTTVQHICALEGMATLVCTVSPPSRRGIPFLEDFATTTFERNYLPIVMLALHERSFVSELTSNAIFWPESTSQRAQIIHNLTEIRERHLQFRLCYRYSEVSRVSMHNALNIALRHALNLDVLQRELEGDVAEITTFLQAVESERSETRFRWASILGAAAVSWLTSYKIFKETLNAIKFKGEAFKTIFPAEVDITGLTSIIFGLIIGIVTGIIIWKKRSHSGHTDHRGR